MAHNIRSYRYLWERAALSALLGAATCAFAKSDPQVAPVSELTLAPQSPRDLLPSDDSDASGGGGGTANVLCAQPPANCQTCDQLDGRSSVRALNRRVADDFRPAASGNITSLCWWGMYGTSTCQTTTPDNFQIRYYADNNGLPGALIGGPFLQTGGTLAVERAATGGTVADLPEFEYTATHAPVPVQAFRCYWLEITNHGGTPYACGWFWESAARTNNLVLYDLNNTYAASDRFALDVAWCLNLALDDVNNCAAPVNDNCDNAVAIACEGSASADNTLATTAAGDPVFACRGGAAGQGVGTVWFSFVANGPTAEVRTCGSTAPNTLLAAYDGDCGNLIPLGCNDDANLCAPGSGRSRLCLSGLTPGVRYLVQAATVDHASRGMITVGLNCFCAPRCTEPPANCQTFGTNDAVASDASFRSADDFRPASSGTITSVCAWGIYQNNQPNPTDSFEIRYFTDGGNGIPGTQLAVFRHADGTLMQNPRVDSGANSQGFFDIFEYSFTHAPFSVSGNECYWIEIRNIAGPRQWSWTLTDNDQGNGRRAQDRNGSNSYDSAVDKAAGDLAFCVDRPLGDGTACLPPAPPNMTCATASEITCSVGGTFVVVNNTLSNALPDPAFGCSAGGAGALWYKFEATHTTARLRTCQSAAFGDSILAAYSGECDALTLRSCVDDNCGSTGELSDLVIVGLTPGETYFVQFAAFNVVDQGLYTLELRCPADVDGCAGFLLGDSNGDLLVNNFDIDAFVLAVSDPVAYMNAFCNGEMNCLMCRNDIDHSGAANNFDIDPFVACLSNLPPSGQGCP